MLDFSAIGIALNWWLIGSCRTGEFIVYTGISLIEMLANAVKSFNSVSILLYEGSTLWFEDIHEFLCLVQELIYNICDYILEIGTFLMSIAAKAVYTPFSILATILASIRELLLLLGSSCLFLLSLPSLFLFYFIDTILHAFKTFGSFVQILTKRFAEHAADIQTLEALLGLIVVCGLIIIGINGIKFMTKSYVKLKNITVRGLRTTWRNGRTWMASVRRRRRQQQNKDCKQLRETELCIVCFEEARSVCILPCRHLSLCLTCTESLPYPLRCPLCRQRAEDLIHVYL